MLCWWMHRQTLAVLVCMHKGFPAKKVKQMIVISQADITMIAHARKGGKHKRRSTRELGVSCQLQVVSCHQGFLILNFRVLQ